MQFQGPHGPERGFGQGAIVMKGTASCRYFMKFRSFMLNPTRIFDFDGWHMFGGPEARYGAFQAIRVRYLGVMKSI